MTTIAANSALQRARATMNQHLPDRRLDWSRNAGTEAAERTPRRRLRHRTAGREVASGENGCMAQPASRDLSVVTPAGLGVAVVFLWALATQLTVQGIAGLVGGLGLHHGVGGLLARLVPATVLVVTGESLRQGRRWARWTAIVLALLITVSGVLRALAVVSGHGLPHRVVLSLLIELTFAPWIALRLSAPRTVEWFALASERGPARRAIRTGPGWLAGLAAWSVPWGVAVAVSQSLHG
jgi:hypothetical protein